MASASEMTADTSLTDQENDQENEAATEAPRIPIDAQVEPNKLFIFYQLEGGAVRFYDVLENFCTMYVAKLVEGANERNKNARILLINLKESEVFDNLLGFLENSGEAGFEGLVLFHKSTFARFTSHLGRAVCSRLEPLTSGLSATCMVDLDTVEPEFIANAFGDRNFLGVGTHTFASVYAEQCIEHAQTMV